MNRVDSIFYVNEISTDSEVYFKDADEILFNNCVFIYNPVIEAYHPITGEYTVLGSEVPVRQFSFTELKDTKSNIQLIFFKKKLLPEKDNKLFNIVKYEERIDYTGTLTKLEKSDIVKIKPSECQLATDERMFRFIDEKEWYEADILGTSYGKIQTDKLVKKYFEHYNNNERT